MWFNVALVIFLLMNFFIIIVVLGTILNNQKSIMISLHEVKQFLELQMKTNAFIGDFINVVLEGAKQKEQSDDKN